MLVKVKSACCQIDLVLQAIYYACSRKRRYKERKVKRLVVILLLAIFAGYVSQLEVEVEVEKIF